MAMKEVLKKKGVKVALGLIGIVMAAIIVGFVVQGGREQKLVTSHLELADKFLEELDYEQAITEYTAVLEIEPKNQRALNGLETAYLEYARDYKEAEEYDRAIDILKKASEVFQSEILIQQIHIIEKAKEEKRAKELEQEKEREQEKKEEEKRKAEEEAKKRAEEEAAERTRKVEEEKIEIYKWEISRMELWDILPNSWWYRRPSWVEFTDETEDVYIFDLYIGLDDVFNFTFEVNKTNGNGEVTAYSEYDYKSGTWREWSEEWRDWATEEYVGMQVNLQITEEIKGAYLVYKEKEDKVQQCISAVDTFILEHWKLPEGKEYRMTDYELGPGKEQNVWLGLCYHEKGGTGTFFFTLDADSDMKQIEVSEVDFVEPDSQETMDSAKSLIGSSMQLAVLAP